MNNHVNAIANRLSLRQPQRDSLKILERICELLPIQNIKDIETSLAAIKKEFPTVTDFEREFPSLCFSLATGVGKTRLMGAFISYLHLAHGIKNFFVLAPNLTIYNKLITDFTPNTSKYVFTGITEFAINPPEIITGDNYEMRARTILDEQISCKINIFNISKINSEVRGGKSPKIKRLSEYIGESYFDYLSQLKDLVILMDESHRYRASAGVRAINELKPLLGLEVTATPFIETNKGSVPFKNVIYDYPLGRAMSDGFVKDPAVVTRKDFNPASMSPEAIERLKLEDGIYLHENIKAELETYAIQTGKKIVKPFMLIIARDITHAIDLMRLIQSDEFAEGEYKHKVIQVDSSKTGAQEDEMVDRLLKVESPDEPTEIVIHVNMLKEGWDVTNLYTIVPLRAANSKILIEQSIGRGLRLPYGMRTGVEIVDRLNIVCHDKFQEIVDEAKKPESQIRLKQIILTEEDLQQKTQPVISRSQLSQALGLHPEPSINLPDDLPNETEPQLIQPPLFTTPIEQKIAQLTYQAILKLESQPEKVPTTAHLSTPKIQAIVREAVVKEYQPAQMEIEGVTPPPNIEAIVAKTTNLVIQQTIDIPRILVLPIGTVRSGFRSFAIDLSDLNYGIPSKEELHIQSLSTEQSTSLEITRVNFEKSRLENYIVESLAKFDDICYDEHSDLLYDLVGQVVSHFLKQYSEDDIRNILRVRQNEIANFIHHQMQQNFWEETTDYEVKISKGFTTLKDSAYNTSPKNRLDYRFSPPDKSNMSKYLFTGFSKCLYKEQKFQSEAERILAIILEREAIKWFKPAKGQFQLYYKWHGNYSEYQPDFVAETADIIYMLEPKAQNETINPEVLAKKDVAIQWCKNASDHMLTHGGKPWQYVLIPHDAIAQNMTIKGLGDRFS
ncbi:MAG: DEAD/DEAH box helicase family protein [Pseudanabaena sp. Salubria-1]|nr:DEAD/DEAH box helicase family protein [Pseudanabaena sp. Salubria-1]